MQVLKLYRDMLRASAGFQDSGVRAYALRRVKQGFREKQHLVDEQQIEAAVARAKQDLEMLRRQSAISQMYPAPPFVTDVSEAGGR